MLLDRNLGNMMDLMVDLISNLVDHRGSGNNNGSSMGNSKRDSMGKSKRGSIGNSYWGSINNCRCRSIDTSNRTVSNQPMSKKTMPKKTTSNDLSISISSGGSKATGNKGKQNDKRLHIDCAESIPTIPMYSAL